MQEQGVADVPKPVLPAAAEVSVFGKDSSKSCEKANRIEMDALWRFSVELQQQLDVIHAKVNKSMAGDFPDERYMAMLTARIDECMKAFRGTFQREQAALVDRISAITLNAVQPLLHGEMELAAAAERRHQRDALESYFDESKLVCRAPSPDASFRASSAEKQLKLRRAGAEGEAAVANRATSDFPCSDELRRWHEDVRLACAELAPCPDDVQSAGLQHALGKSRQRLLVPVLHKIGHRVRCLESAVRVLQSSAVTADRGIVQDVQSMLDQLRPNDSMVPARLKELQDQLETLIARLKAGVVPGQRVDATGRVARPISPMAPASPAPYHQPALPGPSVPSPCMSHCGSLSAAAWGAVSSMPDGDGCREPGSLAAGQHRPGRPAVAVAPAAAEPACVMRSRATFRTPSPVPRPPAPAAAVPVPVAVTMPAPHVAGRAPAVMAAGPPSRLVSSDSSVAPVYGSFVVSSQPASRAGSPAYGASSPVVCPAAAPNWKWVVGHRTPPGTSPLRR